MHRSNTAPATLVLLVLLSFTGCASLPKRSAASNRPFVFEKDTFVYPNGLVWEYFYDANGDWTTQRRHPKPKYYQHCYVVARSALQFYQNARFAPELPGADDTTYRKLVRRVVAVDPMHQLPESRKTVIPGYADLREFSQAREALLKEETGSALRCYVQRGNWRMIWPFPRSQQARIANELLAEIRANQPPVVHIARFPSLSINHAVLLFGAQETEKEILFTTYDPNNPVKPMILTYTRATRTFSLAPNNYFPGGKVNIYQIYRNLCY